MKPSSGSFRINRYDSRDTCALALCISSMAAGIYFPLRYGAFRSCSITVSHPGVETALAASPSSTDVCGQPITHLLYVLKRGWGGGGHCIHIFLCGEHTASLRPRVLFAFCFLFLKKAVCVSKAYMALVNNASLMELFALYEVVERKKCIHPGL